MVRPVGPSTKVYALRVRNDKASPYIVAWKYRGRETQRSFAMKTEAETARVRLIDMINSGGKFNPATGWPVDWEAGSKTTVAEAAYEWFQSNIGRWEPHTRRSAAEPLANLIIQLRNSRYSQLPDSGMTRTRLGVVEEISPVSAMRGKILDWLATPPDKAKMPDWVKRASLPLRDVTPEHCFKASTLMALREDGSGTKSLSVQARYRSNCTAFFDWCLDNNLIYGVNPWPKPRNTVKRTKKETAGRKNAKIKSKDLPSPAIIETAIAWLLDSPNPGRRARGIVLGLEFYGGLRPGEAVALKIENCDLPDQGWGTVTVKEARIATTNRWTRTNEVVGDPKTEQRITTIPPAFVERLRTFINGRQNGLVAPNTRGGVLDIGNVNSSFHEACIATAGRAWRQYDLRAARATVHTNAGRAHAQVAAEMGHSVTVLQGVYMRTVESEMFRGLDAVEGVLTAKKKSPAKKASAKKKSPAKKASAKKKTPAKKASTAKKASSKKKSSARR